MFMRLALVVREHLRILSTYVGLDQLGGSHGLSKLLQLLRSRVPAVIPSSILQEEDSRAMDLGGEQANIAQQDSPRRRSPWGRCVAGTKAQGAADTEL